MVTSGNMVKYQKRKTKLPNFVLRKREETANKKKEFSFPFWEGVRQIAVQQLRNYFQDLTSLSKIPVTHLPCHGFKAVVFDSHRFFEILG